MALYLASERYAALHPNTARTWGGLARELAAVFGRVRPADVAPRDAAHWIGLGLTVSNRRRRRAVFGAVWKCAAAAADLPPSPVADMRLPTPPARTRYVTDAELAAFLRLAPDDRLRAYVALKLATGLRRG